MIAREALQKGKGLAAPRSGSIWIQAGEGRRRLADRCANISGQRSSLGLLGSPPSSSLPPSQPPRLPGSLLHFTFPYVVRQELLP